MASFEDKFRELERVFQKLSAKFDNQLLASSSYGSDSPGIRSKVGYEDRTLFIKIHLMDYSISWEVLDRVFSRIGNIEYIEVFSDGSPFHSTVRFQETQSAIKAFKCYDGRFIYDGCCRMELSLGNRADGRLSEIDVPIANSSQLQSQESSRRIYKKLNEIRVLMGRCPVEVLSDETEKQTLVQQMQKFEFYTQSNIGVNATIEPESVSLVFKTLEHSGDDGNADLESKPAKSEVKSRLGANVQRREILECPSTEIRAPKVISNLDEDPKELQKINDGIVETEAMHHVVPFDPLPEGNTQSPELEIVVGNIRWKRVVEGSEISIESLEFWNAYQVFVEMPKRKPEVNSMNECHSYADMIIDVAPKGMGDMIKMSINCIELDMEDLGTNLGAHKVFVNMLEKLRVVDDDFIELPSTLGEVFQSIASFRSFIFDRGKCFVFPLHLESSIDDFIKVLNALGDAFGSVQLRSFVFDPGKHMELSLHTTSLLFILGSLAEVLFADIYFLAGFWQWDPGDFLVFTHACDGNGILEVWLFVGFFAEGCIFCVWWLRYVCKYEE